MEKLSTKSTKSSKSFNSKTQIRATCTLTYNKYNKAKIDSSQCTLSYKNSETQKFETFLEADMTLDRDNRRTETVAILQVKESSGSAIGKMAEPTYLENLMQKVEDLGLPEEGDTQRQSIDLECPNCAQFPKACVRSGQSFFPDGRSNHQFVELYRINFVWCELRGDGIETRTLRSDTSDSNLVVEQIEVPKIRRNDKRTDPMSIARAVLELGMSKGPLFKRPEVSSVDQHIDDAYAAEEATFHLFLLSREKSPSTKNYLYQPDGKKVFVMCPYTDLVCKIASKLSKCPAKLPGRYFETASCDLESQKMVLEFTKIGRNRVLV